MGFIPLGQALPNVAPPVELHNIQNPARTSLCCNRWTVMGGFIGVSIANIYQPLAPWTVSEKIMVSCLGYIVGWHVGNGLYRLKGFCKNRYVEDG